MQKPVNDHSFESGVLEQGNISNVQDRGSLRTRKTSALNHGSKQQGSTWGIGEPQWMIKVNSEGSSVRVRLGCVSHSFISI